MLAWYNRIANERLYEKCAALDRSEYLMERRGSFGSIQRLLNHLLLGDQTWMERFEGRGLQTPPLDTLLFDDFLDLRSARVQEDARIERFFTAIDDAFLSGSFAYVNNQGMRCVDPAPVAVGHFFNHQTHHRGQVHVMLSQTSIVPPALDMHRIINP